MDQRLLSLFTLFPINNAGAKIRDKLNSATGLITVASLFRYAKGLFMIFVKNISLMICKFFVSKAHKGMYRAGCLSDRSSKEGFVLQNRPFNLPSGCPDGSKESVGT